MNKVFFAQNVAQSVPITGGYGLLYNRYATANALFAPTDCHLPTSAEFQTLSTYLGGDLVSGAPLKEVGTIHWSLSGGTNSSNFTGLGAGIRTSLGAFSFLKTAAFLWTDSIYDATNYYDWVLQYNNTTFGAGISKLQYGLSVRLLYTGINSTVTDYDGNVYNVITIGTQKWLKQNWKCTHLSDGTLIPEETDASTWNGLTTGALCAYDNDWGKI